MRVGHFSNHSPFDFNSNNATFEDRNENVDERKANGDATDVALLKFSAKFDNLDVLNKEYTIMADIPFNSRNKWMMKIVRSNEMLFDETRDLNSHLILLKGAPDYLLKKATHINDFSGTPRPLKDGDIDAIQRTQNDWCMLGQRVLLICKKQCNFVELSSKFKTTAELEKYIHDSNDFSILGLIGIIDPPRYI